MKFCMSCENCQYVGEGDYYCDNIQEVVITDHVEFTEHHFGCKGKYYTEEE